MAAGLADGYSVLAEHYDALMRDVPYSRWIDFISSYALSLGKSDLSIIDAGCGTGTLTLGLYQRGFQVIGVDQSWEMLSLARFKSDQLNLPITWVGKSFTTLDMSGDIIVCTCDGINHILTTRELVNFFKHAYRCLSNSGYLIFDINSEYKFKKVLAANTFYWKIPNLEVIWVNEFFQPWNRANITLFNRRETDFFTKATLEINQRCYKLPSLIYYLRKCGFKNIELWNNYKSRLKNINARRITVVAQKL